jgi:hypothetical protein
MVNKFREQKDTFQMNKATMNIHTSLKIQIYQIN